MNRWKQGKIETQKYYDLKIKKSTDIKSLLFGLLLTLVVIAPFLLVLVQLFKVYFYHPTIKIILIIIAWMLLMICNGLSNVFMVKLAKSYFPENPNLTNIDEKSIFVFQTFNIGFAVFTVAIIIIFGVL